MNRFPLQKIQKSVFMLSLIFASIACNIPGVYEAVEEAVFEKCYPVNQRDYERAAAEAGQTPETPKYPESAVYEVCYMNDGDEVSSVRMSEGYSSEDAEPTINEDGISIPAGTYTGKFPWNESSINELLANEIVVEISSNGLVSGLATMHQSHNEIHNSAAGECTSHYEYWISYTVSGQIADSYDEPVKVQHTSYEISDWTACGQKYKRTDDACDCDALLTISDGELIITCGTGNKCEAYLTATR